MVQRVVPVPFSAPPGTRSNLPFPETNAGQESLSGFAYPLDSVPPPRFSRMPPQDLAIWTPARLIQALAQALTESFRPAELRPIRLNKDDHA
jgi:hypothetical protein